MPAPSAFDPCGMLTLSSDPSYAEVLYDALLDGESAAFDETVGGHREATNYARAMGLARIRCTLEHAGNQVFAQHCTSLLPDFEARFGLSPGPTDSIPTRQAALAAAKRFSRGARRESVVGALRSICGTDFLALRVTRSNELIHTTPATDVTNCVRSGVVPKFLQLVDPITTLGSPVDTLYENLDTTAADVALVPGDTVVASAGHTALHEKVVVSSVSAPGAPRSFTATFTKSHDVGAVVTTMDYPYEWSNQRVLIAILKSASARSAVVRRKVNEVMRKLCRAVDTWAIVEPAAPGALVIGPFTIGSSILGGVVLGAFDFTLDP